jgi:hypothetical protein
MASSLRLTFGSGWILKIARPDLDIGLHQLIEDVRHGTAIEKNERSKGPNRHTHHHDQEMRRESEATNSCFYPRAEVQWLSLLQHGTNTRL